VKKWLVVLLLLSATAAHGQLWSGVIDPARAIDWTGAGISGGIPSASWTQCGATIAAYTGSGSTITNALNHTGTGYTSCGNNTYVQLGAGTFSLSSAVYVVGHSTTELRGTVSGGVNQTTINYTAVSTCNGGNGTCGIGFASSDGTTPGGPPSTIYNWTAGYSKGATSITISSGVGIVANQTMLVLDECDSGYSGAPCTGLSTDTGNLYWCSDQYATTPSGCATSGPDTGFARPHRFTAEAKIVLTCSPACGTASSTVVTFADPLAHTYWQSGNTPQVYLIQPITNVGVQNLTINNSATTNTAGISFFSCAYCWVSGVAVLNTNNIGIWLQQSVHTMVQSNYVYNAGQARTNTDPTGIKYNWDNNLIANNIIQAVAPSFLSEGPGVGNVLVANYSINAYTGTDFMFTLGQDGHSEGDDYNLYESNFGNQFSQDQVHGTHLFETWFRSVATGWESCANGQCGSFTSKGSNEEAVSSQSYNRYEQFIYNILGTPGFHTTYNVGVSACNAFPENSGVIWATGCGNSAASPALPGDQTLVNGSSMRWGNWDVVNNSAQFNTAEVPSSFSVLPNAIPTTACTSGTTCPPSFYYTSRPSWWAASIPFPAIGEDVTGGNVGQCTGTLNTAGHMSGTAATAAGQCTGTSITAAWGGHINAIPAMACYLNVMGGPPDGTGSALTFNANLCYGAGPTVSTSLSGLLAMARQP